MTTEEYKIISDIEATIIEERDKISFDVGEKEKLINSGICDGLNLALDIIDYRLEGVE